MFQNFKMSMMCLNQIKLSATLASSNLTSDIVLGSGAVHDMSTNAIAGTSGNPGLAPDVFTADNVKPTIDFFDLDLSGTPTLHLYLDEPVVRSTVQPTNITLSGGSAGSSNITLSGQLTPSAGHT